jgi:hypothetical protein
MAHANDSAVVDTLDTVTRPWRPQDSVTSLSVWRIVPVGA